MAGIAPVRTPSYADPREMRNMLAVSSTVSTGGNSSRSTVAVLVEEVAYLNAEKRRDAFKRLDSRNNRPPFP